MLKNDCIRNASFCFFITNKQIAVFALNESCIQGSILWFLCGRDELAWQL